MKPLNPILISGREVLPLVEGGKGINVSTGVSSGAWAAAGGVGTISGVNPDSVDADGRAVRAVYRAKTRIERQHELIAHGINGGIAQARIAHEVANGKGRLHLNVLWEMGGAEQVLLGVLEGAKGLIHGITCGAGMPYKVAEIADRFGVYYYPIVSSARAFRALWKRAYSKHAGWLGGVVYEDPWLAGGHNGLTNSEDPVVPQPPYGRVRELRAVMVECGLAQTPIFMAGGVWALDDWQDWIDNPELGPIAFQFGTRPLLTTESPISDVWKKRLLTLKSGDVLLHKFSPTGFYSSAVKNAFILDLVARSERQITYCDDATPLCAVPWPVGKSGRVVHVAEADAARAKAWSEQGFIVALRTPDQTVVFVTPEQAATIHQDQTACCGCLSGCAFSSWMQSAANGSSGRISDPRSFCIQRTLQEIGHGGDVENELMFAGQVAYRFAQDPFYANGFIPTTQQLIDRILTGK